MTEQNARYIYVDCEKCRTSMVLNERLGVWECNACGNAMRNVVPPHIPNEWEKYVAKTSTAYFQNMSQEVTLRCPTGCGQFISTDWEGCYGCGFKWGDTV